MFVHDEFEITAHGHDKIDKNRVMIFVLLYNGPMFSVRLFRFGREVVSKNMSMKNLFLTLVFVDDFHCIRLILGRCYKFRRSNKLIF